MQVDWSEINAALGQAALLLTVIAEKAGLRFTKHILLPQGSFAKLGKPDDRRTLYQLYTDGSFSLFPKRNFNHALTGFLACIQELGQKVVEQDPTLQLPYHIQDDKIHDISITVSGADEDHWTRALKYMLTNLKWIVAWSTKHLQGA
jgi:beclin 1